MRLLYLIKSRGPQSTQAVASALAITLPGARKHLNALLDKDLVAFEDVARSVGRPKRLWRLTLAAERRFPDTHAASDPRTDRLGPPDIRRRRGSIGSSPSGKGPWPSAIGRP